MLTSELIKELQRAVAQFGDRPVEMVDGLPVTVVYASAESIVVSDYEPEEERTDDAQAASAS